MMIDTPDTPPDPSTPPVTLRRAAPLLAIVLAAVVGFFVLGDRIGFHTLADNRETLLGWRDANYALAAVIFMLAYVVVVALSLPGALMMTLLGGFLFGLAVGGALTLVGATIGATLIFLAARFGLGVYLASRISGASGMLGRISDGLHKNEISYLLIMRLVPVVPFFVANLAPALLGVRLRNYFWTTLFGIMPGTLVYTWVGSGLGQVFASGEAPDLGLVFEPHILGPLLGLAALAALPILVRAVQGSRT